LINSVLISCNLQGFFHCVIHYSLSLWKVE
jgi:hypothetical protein